MKKLLSLLFFSSVVLAEDKPSPVVVIEDSGGWHYVNVSLTDINRIVCPQAIKSVVYSKEKEISVEVQERNAYVKFLPKVLPDGKVELSDIPRELYVDCGEKVFQLILVPKRIPAVVVALRVPHEDKEKARQLERSGDYDSVLLGLVKSVYMEEVPEGYEVKLINKPYRSFEELDMILYRVYEGSMYSVEEYVLQAKTDLELWEGQFIPYLKQPLAIAIVQPVLKKGQTTRLIVVRRNA